MTPAHLYENARQEQNKNPLRLNVKASKKTEDISLSYSKEQRSFFDPIKKKLIGKSPLQSGSSSSRFLSPTKKVFSYLEANHAQNRQVLQESWRKGQAQRKKRLSTTPIPDKKNYTRTLSESFVNLIMVDGKKRKAEKIFSQTLKKLADHLQNDIKRENKRKVTPLDREKDETSLPTLYRKDRDPLHVARKVNYTEGSLLILRNQVEKRSVHHLLQKAIDHVKPTLQVRKVRVARSIYQVPFIMKRRRQERSAIRWIIESARKKSQYSQSAFSECLAQTVLEAFMGHGQVREKRDQLHRTAEANRTYLRYRWW